MKKYIIIPLLLLISWSYSQKVYLINEDFNSGFPTSWTHNSTNWGTSPIWTVASGAISDNSGPYFGAVSNWVELPAINLTTVTAPFLEIELAMALIDTSILFSVEYSTNGTWNSLSTFGTATSSASNTIAVASAPNTSWTPMVADYQTISIDLMQFTNESSILFRFGSEFLNASASGVWFLDSVKIFGNTITTGIVKYSEPSAFRLIPNPANGLVRLVPNKHAENTTLKITSISGSIVLEKLITSTIEEIDVSGYNSGIYLVHYISNEKVSTERLVIH